MLFQKNPIQKSTKLTESVIDKFNSFIDTYENEVSEANRSVPGLLSDMEAFGAEIFARVYDDSEIIAESSDYHWINRVMNSVREMREFKDAQENNHRDRDESGFFSLGFASTMVQKLCGGRKFSGCNEEEKRAYMDEMAKSVQESSDAAIRNAAREAIEDGDEMVDYLRDMKSIGNLCSEETGIGGEKSSTEILMSAERRLKEKMQKIAKTLGRFKSMAKGAITKKSTIGKSELFGTKLGGDIANLITPEISKLAIGGAISAEVAGRIVNGNAIQFAFRGKNKEGMGPVLVYVDGSGSMMESMETGTREQWAKAIGLTLCMIAKNQKREFKFCQFDGSVHTYGTLNSEFTAQEMITAMDYFPCGGTAFFPPARDALSILKTCKKFSKADVVIVTDGVSRDTESAAKVIREIKATGARFHFIKLGSFVNALDEVADQKFTILTGMEAEIESVFNGVAKEK